MRMKFPSYSAGSATVPFASADRFSVMSSLHSDETVKYSSTFAFLKSKSAVAAASCSVSAESTGLMYISTFGAVGATTLTVRQTAAFSSFSGGNVTLLATGLMYSVAVSPSNAPFAPFMENGTNLD